MTLLEYLSKRELGRGYKWKYFEDIYPGSDIKDWRRGHEIIKLNESKKFCYLCNNNYQRIIIKIPEMIDTYGFCNHLFFEFACMYCNAEYYIDRYKH